ncbi:uncharacterized protein EV420DRAFT_1501096 [Desarmillaria tabescens]|uniref:2',3'-cyclic-nucleotide 3'-phosphodiesterase n=1 Tax=Armillaria tabescens TaxID=1929756 RepID=A0AA39NLB1_ARMTA|nr:uncharacterized protein EV420DRAFT_1501096 [Desarmillaria tabescens]KAK0467740.1 hypothetical protein EV420DRAFT_1501096 [Desarmillaria tabescens]
MGYALWLIPSPEEYNAWEELMKFRPPHSSVKPDSKSYPRFAPHITLATFADFPPALDINKLPIYDLRPPVMKMKFESWKRGDTYLGALVIKLSEPRELKRLHGVITSYLGTLGAQWKSRNFPHMSLFYVDEPQERFRLEEGLKDYKGMGTFGDRGYLALRSRFTFTGTEVWLVDCTRSVRQWQVMEKRSLSSSRLRELRSRHTGSATLPVPTRAGPSAPAPASVSAPQITKQSLYQPQYTTSPSTKKTFPLNRTPSRSTPSPSKTNTLHSCSRWAPLRIATTVSRPKELRRRHLSESLSSPLLPSPSPSASATTSISDAQKMPISPTYKYAQPTRYSQLEAESSITAMDADPPPVGAAPHLL